VLFKVKLWLRGAIYTTVFFQVAKGGALHLYDIAILLEKVTGLHYQIVQRCLV